MKRIISITLLMIVIVMGFAQKPSLNKAYNAFSNGDFIEAKGLIDLCIEDPEVDNKSDNIPL